MSDAPLSAEEAEANASASRARLEQTYLEGHYEDDCEVLDPTCAARAWAALRRSDPSTVFDVELLYGKDWWLRYPTPLLPLLGMMVLWPAADPDTREARVSRGTRSAINKLHAEKIKAIQRDVKRRSRGED